MKPPDEETRELLRRIPQVNELADRALELEEAEGLNRRVLLETTRSALEDVRSSILVSDGRFSAADLDEEALARMVVSAARGALEPRLVRVINATGVVLHTNLGRAPLPEAAVEAVRETSSGYCNLEYRLSDGTRGSRQEYVEPLLCSLTGAEAALAVNNNAAAVLLVLAGLARGREVIVSRGELVEIGDSFRLPDIMAQGGARLVEVGTTNRTRLSDYRNAIGPDTGMIMKIHRSNFRIVGYTEDVPIRELVELGAQSFLPVVEDLGSGLFASLEPLGVRGEHTPADSLREGADLVTFSGDKLAGGPQAGLVVGRRDYVEELRKHPLARAVRIDKMVVAALEATLRAYLDPEAATSSVPALRMLLEPAESVRRRAGRLKRLVESRVGEGVSCSVVPEVSRAGGGSLPLAEINTYCLALRPSGIPVAELEGRLRLSSPAVLGRVKEDMLLLDLRTVFDHEVRPLAEVVSGAILADV